MYRFLLLLLLLVPLHMLQSQTDPLDQRLSMVIEDASLETVLIRLVQEQSVPIVFRNDLIPQRSITVSFNEHRLEEVLRYLLENTDLRFRAIGELIVLEPIPPPPPQHTISGFVSDTTTGERLIGATVVELNSQIGTYSDEYGFYSLRLPAGKQDIRVSYTGYQAAKEVLHLAKAKDQNFFLQPSLTLREIVVIGRDSVRSISEPARGSGILLDAKQAELLPTLGGEADILRMAHFLPGVHTGTDGIDGLHIRGGDAGQNLVLIDGVPIYDVNHALGLFSIFDAGAVRQATLYKGGFPARFGGRLSGVLDVRTKEGNLKKISGKATLGLLATKLQLEGPIATDRTSFFLSGRRSFINAYLRPFTSQLKAERGEEGETSYSFYDLNFKLQHILGPRDRLHFSYYQGKDDYVDHTGSTIKFDLEYDGVVRTYRIDQYFRERIRWGNKASSIRWNHNFGKKLVANLALTYSQLDVIATSLQNDSITLLSTGQTIKVPRYSRFDTGIKDLGAKLDFHFVAGPRSDWRFGMEKAVRDFSPGVFQVDQGDDLPIEEDFVQDPIRGHETSFYLEQSWQLSDRLRSHWGARLSRWRTGEKIYSLPQVRLQLDWQFSQPFSWHGSVGKMVQFLHLLSNSTIGLPTDLWVPATESISPANAWHYSTGLRWQPHQNIAIDLDLYYKELNDLVEFSEGANFVNDWENNVSFGSGKAKGVEVLVRYNSKRLQTQVAYTLAESRRQFDNRINFGASFPFKYDRRHDLKATLIYQLRPWLHLSADWIFNTGFAFSLPREKYRIIPVNNIPGGNPVEVIDFGEKNSFRMPNYHRMDLNLQARFGKRRLQHQLNVGVYNLYNRQNPLYIDLRTRYVVQNNRLDVVRQFVQVWLAPLLPSLSYAVSF